MEKQRSKQPATHSGTHEKTWRATKAMHNKQQITQQITVHLDRYVHYDGKRGEAVRCSVWATVASLFPKPPCVHSKHCDIQSSRHNLCSYCLCLAFRAVQLYYNFIRCFFELLNPNCLAFSCHCMSFRTVKAKDMQWPRVQVGDSGQKNVAQDTLLYKEKGGSNVYVMCCYQ